MFTVSKQQLKQEIDQLDTDYLELVYKVLRQFPHQKMDNKTPLSLRGSVLSYLEPTQPVALNDWDVIQ
ncbi:hypothetical protein [Thioflexithrix psekupsensis]|uniref:Uncharacterized protein n=1 Tax=Thioflexithrix psekupsensis TaxID=1570016 RepID=A0A251X9L9_9GAMM|nr:hypothetical protein [Thioflexithrix psekupsensis]OUD14373.1 hypothetical protein TPSD3_08640 [Thioflexithrix psekupsensis]